MIKMCSLSIERKNIVFLSCDFNDIEMWWTDPKVVHNDPAFWFTLLYNPLPKRVGNTRDVVLMEHGKGYEMSRL